MNADDYRDNFNDSDDSQFEEVLPEYDDDYEDDDADYEDDYYEDDYNISNKRSIATLLMMIHIMIATTTDAPPAGNVPVAE